MIKREIRNKYKTIRNKMEPAKVQELSNRICGNLMESSLYKQAEYIYAYYPLGNEADIRSLVERAWAQGKRVAFPKVFGENMAFFEVCDFSELSPGTFGVMEPEENCPADWEYPLVLTPGVAFDRAGNRLGYGKGYYDRYFEDKPGAVMIGVAYELQMAEQIPVGEFDRVLDGIVTDICLYECLYGQ